MNMPPSSNGSPQTCTALPLEGRFEDLMSYTPTNTSHLSKLQKNFHFFPYHDTIQRWVTLSFCLSQILLHAIHFKAAFYGSLNEYAYNQHILK